MGIFLERIVILVVATVNLSESDPSLFLSGGLQDTWNKRKPPSSYEWTEKRHPNSLPVEPLGHLMPSKVNNVKVLSDFSLPKKLEDNAWTKRYSHGFAPLPKWPRENRWPTRYPSGGILKWSQSLFTICPWSKECDSQNELNAHFLSDSTLSKNTEEIPWPKRYSAGLVSLPKWPQENVLPRTYLPGGILIWGQNLFRICPWRKGCDSESQPNINFLPVSSVPKEPDVIPWSRRYSAGMSSPPKSFQENLWHKKYSPGGILKSDPSLFLSGGLQDMWNKRKPLTPYEWTEKRHPNSLPVDPLGHLLPSKGTRMLLLQKPDFPKNSGSFGYPGYVYKKPFFGKKFVIGYVPVY